MEFRAALWTRPFLHPSQVDVETGETGIPLPDADTSPPSYEETMMEESNSPRSSSTDGTPRLQVDVVAELSPMLLSVHHNLFGQGLMCQGMSRRLGQIENNLAELTQATNLRFYLSLLLIGLVGISFIGLMIILFRVGWSKHTMTTISNPKSS